MANISVERTIGKAKKAVLDGLVALVQERYAEGEADIVEDPRVLGPGDHRARAHHRG